MQTNSDRLPISYHGNLAESHTVDDGQHVDIFHSKRCEDIPDATSSQNGLTTDAHPNTKRLMAEETRSPAQQIYIHTRQNAGTPLLGTGSSLNILTREGGRKKSRLSYTLW